VFYRMISRLALRVLIVSAFLAPPLGALEHPANQIQIKFPETVSVSPGGSQPVEISITIPKNYHVYLNHATPIGNAILIQLSIPAESGFQLRETKRAAGVRDGDEMVLRGSGSFSTMVMDLAKYKTDSTHRVPLRLRVQICQDSPAICYLPTTIEKTLNVKISGAPFASRASSDNKIPWAKSLSQAQALAKSKSVNIFALISSPATCSACAYLEDEVFSQPDVAAFLTSKFVPYRIPSSEYGKFVTESPFGIPAYYAVSADGVKLKTFEGASDPAGFISGLKPFSVVETPATTTTTTATTTTNANQINLTNGSRKCKIELKKSYAYRAMQKGEFQNTGNVRIVTNISNPGTYTILQLGRTAEVEASYNATSKGGSLIVQRYLGQDDLSLSCSDEGLSGEIKASGLEMIILLPR